MIGSIIWFAYQCWLIFEEFFLFPFYFGTYIYFGTGWTIPLLVAYVLPFVSSLLLMIGFIMFRGEQSRLASAAPNVAVPPTSPQAQGAPARFCPKCGRQVLADAQFCGFCGSPVEGTKRK
jgi:hypothetical protein